MADDVQPDMGQGENGTGIFDSYLQTVPDDAREYVTGYLKDAEKNVNTRLQEAAELRPYQEAGITQLDPQGLKQLVDWYGQVTSDDGAWKEFISSAAREAGLSLAEAQQLEDVPDDLSRDKIAEMVSELADQRVAPLQDWIAQQDFNTAVDAENRLIVDRLDSLQREHGVTLSEEERAAVLDLGSAAMPDDGQTMSAGHDWVGAGWDRFQKMGANAQKTFIEGKLNQPAPALSAGGTEQPQPNTDWKVAHEQALERLRQSRS